MDNDFVTKTLRQVKELGKELGERARESAAVTSHQAEELAGKARDEAVKAAPQARDLLDRATRFAADAISRIDGKPRPPQ